MDYIRAALSLIVFIIGGVIVYDLLVSSFNFLLLVAAIGCFAASHFLWPENATEAHDWFYWLGFVVDAPGRAVIWVAQKLIRVLRGDWDDLV